MHGAKGAATEQPSAPLVVAASQGSSLLKRTLSWTVLHSTFACKGAEVWQLLAAKWIQEPPFKLDAWQSAIRIGPLV